MPVRRYSKGAARRQEIIQTAMEIFSTVGYNKSSMLEISEKSGLTRAGLAHYFPTKESLLTAVLDWREKEDGRRFMGNRDDIDPLDFFRRLLTLTAHNATIPGLIALYMILSAEASAPDHPAHDYFVERYKRNAANMTKGIRKAIDAHIAIPGLDADDFAVRLTAVMDGLQTQWLLSSDDFDMVKHLRPVLQEALIVDIDTGEVLSPQ